MNTKENCFQIFYENTVIRAKFAAGMRCISLKMASIFQSVSKQTTRNKSFVKKYDAEKYGLLNTVCKIDIIGFNNSSFLPF
jgi:hypothetical protein